VTLTRRTFAVALLALMLLAIGLRVAFPTADPPWRTQVGVVWHDEGAWTHNARNRALFGEWRLDAWNPIFLAPVFTGLEYASFATFGVGTWQRGSFPKSPAALPCCSWPWASPESRPANPP
jgi:hypothetical protein